MSFSKEDLAYNNLINVDSHNYNYNTGIYNDLIEEESEIDLNEENKDDMNHDYKFDLNEEEIIRRYLKETDIEMKEYCKPKILKFIKLILNRFGLIKTTRIR